VKKFREIDRALDGKPKHFDFVRIYNTSVEELPENMFSNLTFDRIYVFRNKDLGSIHPNAFGQKNANISKDLNLEFNNLTSTNIFRVASNFHR